MIKPKKEFDHAQKLIDVYWEKVKEVESALRTANDPNCTRLIKICANNIDKIDKLLNRVETQNQQEEETLGDILQMLIAGFEGRSEPKDIKTWLNFIPWTLEGYLEIYGLLRKPQKIEIPIENKWVISNRKRWSIFIGSEKFVQESYIAQVA